MEMFAEKTEPNESLMRGLAVNQGWGRHLLPHTGPSWLCRKLCLSGGRATLASCGAAHSSAALTVS